MTVASQKTADRKVKCAGHVIIWTQLENPIQAPNLSWAREGDALPNGLASFPIHPGPAFLECPAVAYSR